MAQLPADATGPVIGIFVFTLLCFLSGVLMLWLLWTSNQLFSRECSPAAPTVGSTTAGPLFDQYD